MCSAERRRRQAGFTITEVAVTLALVSAMALLVERTLTTTHEADRYVAAGRIVQERSERIAYSVHGAVSAARRVYQRDAVGLGYLAALDLRRLEPAPGVRLPRFEETRPLGPDLLDDPRTGNALLCVRETDPVACSADPAAGVLRYMDVYHFVCAYPTLAARRVITDDERPARDFVLWYSVGYPSRPQILAIADEDQRARVVANLRTAYGYEHAWDPNAPVEAAFYALDAAGGMAATPVASPRIPELPALTESGVLRAAHAQLARTDAASHARWTVFTAPEAGGWVPDGFEVKVCGLSGNRKVWMRLVVEAQSARGRRAVHGTTLVASVKDL